MTVAIFFMICDLFERFGYYSMFGSQIVTFFTRELGIGNLLATQLQVCVGGEQCVYLGRAFSSVSFLSVFLSCSSKRADPT